MKGYAVNPFISLAAVLWGVIPALAKKFYANRTRTGKTVGITLSVIVTGVFSSLILTTAGLVLIMGYSFYAIMPGRIVQFVDDDADLLCSDLYSLFQSADRNRNGTGRAGSEKKDCLKTVCII